MRMFSKVVTNHKSHLKAGRQQSVSFKTFHDLETSKENCISPGFVSQIGQVKLSLHMPERRMVEWRYSCEDDTGQINSLAGQIPAGKYDYHPPLSCYLILCVYVSHCYAVNFIACITKAYCSILSWASWIEVSPSHRVYLKPDYFFLCLFG